MGWGRGGGGSAITSAVRGAGGLGGGGRGAGGKGTPVRGGVRLGDGEGGADMAAVRPERAERGEGPSVLDPWCLPGRLPLDVQDAERVEADDGDVGGADVSLLLGV